MTIPRITAVDFGGADDGGLLVLGPSLGTSAVSLWREAAARLRVHVHVIGWDLPGHGENGAAEPFTMAELAAGVLALVDDAAPGARFHYAGDSVGGCVGLQLALDAPHRITSATVLCTGAAIGTAEGWRERAATVRASGTAALLDSARERWFAPGFTERRTDISSALLQNLRDADAESYAQICEALAGFDVSDRLAEITVPVLAVAGREDVPTPPESLRRIASGVKDGRLVVLDGVGHLAPAEAAEPVAELILEQLQGRDTRQTPTTEDVYDAGMQVRREVLGDAHVDRASAATTEFTADFQRLITEYAWGSIWTRPGLDRRSRSMITLTALVARGHHEELAMHLRAARRNGLSNDEIKEVLMQTAIYCGVPDANTAFRIASGVLSEIDADGGEP
jgi:3-oxoadipate enol-lactonase/4-carboxymuconolactone decarboxylase